MMGPNPEDPNNLRHVIEAGSQRMTSPFSIRPITISYLCIGSIDS
jgi:hypothetical protein